MFKKISSVSVDFLALDLYIFHQKSKKVTDFYFQFGPKEKMRLKNNVYPHNSAFPFECFL